MLEKNTRLESVIKLLDAKARITLWKSESENIFDGYIYQLYDNSEFNNHFVKYIRFDLVSGVTIVLTEEFEK